MVEQLAVVVQADSSIEEVAPSRNPCRIDVADRADHEVERHLELGAELRERPEHDLTNLRMFLGPQVHMMQGASDRGNGFLRGRAKRSEVGRKTNRARSSSFGRKPLEHDPDRLAERRIILDAYTS